MKVYKIITNTGEEFTIIASTHEASRMVADEKVSLLEDLGSLNQYQAREVKNG